MTTAAVQGKQQERTVLWVGSNSDPKKVAGAIAGAVREQGKAEVQTIGAGALNQATKAWAIVRGFLAPQGINLTGYPAFVKVDIDGNERTAIRLYLEDKKS